MKEIFGVWSNDNAELIITSKFMIFFLYTQNGCYSNLYSYELREEKIILNTEAKAFFDKKEKKAICRFYDNENNKFCEIGDRIYLQSYEYFNELNFENFPGKISIKSSEYELVNVNIENKTLIFNDNINKNQELKLVEKIEICKTYDYPNANKFNIAECLRKWRIGSSMVKDLANNFFNLTILTNEHSYIYSFRYESDLPVIYCRAAKYKVTDKGILFAQNIRLLKNKEGFTANILINNYNLSKDELIIDDNLFKPDTCVFANYGNHIYWSLKEFSSNLIILNGCGEDYKFSKPKIGNKTEYFYPYC